MVTSGEAVGPTEPSRAYTTYLTIIALAGWALTSYDMNLLVLTIPDISQDLGLSQSQVGSLVFFVTAAQFVVALFAGYGMDRMGRRRMWMLCLTAAAVFTGMTYFVANFWQLTVMRMLASGFAQAELAVSITIVNEQVPARHRGLLYSLVQGGWPLGVFLASGVYLLFGDLGWRFVFLLGVIPIVMVIIGRMFVRESDRFLHLREVREARAAGDDARVRKLLEEYHVDVAELGEATVTQLFGRPGYVRRQLLLLASIWVCYGASFAATNFYITDFLTRVKGFTSDQAGTLLMVSGAVGFLFYMLGGALGERWGRREVLIVTAPLVAPLNLIFLIVQPAALVAIVYFLIYQVTNGTWSGAGYGLPGRELSDPCARHGGRLSERDDGWRVSHRVSTVDRPDRAHHTDRHLADRRCRHGPRPVADPVAALHPARPGIGGNCDLVHRHAEDAVRFLARGPEPMCYFLSKQQRLRPYLSGQLYFEKIVANYLAGDRGDDLILRHVQNAMGIDQ